MTDTPDTVTKAKKHYKNFIELVETAYETQKTGYDADTDQLIIQGALIDGMEAISNAAISLRAETGKLRTAYFKIAILFLETLHHWEYAYMIASIALEARQQKKYFLRCAGRNQGKKNTGHTMFFDIDKLFDQFEILLDGIE